MVDIDWKTAIPWALSLATLSVGIWQYVDKAAQANREPFLREQLKLAIETSDVVARLSTTTDPKQWETDRNRFWTIYYGPLAFFEDVEVERKMVEVGNVVPRPGLPTPNLPFVSLQSKALSLDYELRRLTLDAWRIDLSNLEMRPVTR